ncbi:hypothetical protein PVL29_011108 [Vitis rotundifolia]|uniref:GDSL esterase/lipase 1-like n=1 Tax=Vitis rotundifolia TaxID=103349 RepID=A0AA38ZMS1_VITRO|nr:hypothetical protein PVL29_011108 [Vitis rotundifolia]
MASLSFQIIHVLVFCACILIPTSSQSHPHQPEKHVALFIFGDSFFDAGNNIYINTTTDYQRNFWPYGETFFDYPTGRASDGRLVPDFIAEYAKLPFLPPYLQPGNNQFTYGSNFASGGAGALDQTNLGLVINLNTQLTYFKDVEKLLRQKLGDEAAKKMLFEAVYLISIGSNDYLSPFLWNSTVLQSYSHEQYIHMVIGNLTVGIKEIYKKGGRKFGLLDVGPLGCVPIMKEIKLQQGGMGCIEEATELAKLHNIALSKVLQELESKLKGFKYSISNFYTFLEERMNNPSKYGFKEGKIACCGSGPFRGLSSCGGKSSIKEYELCSNVSEYVFFDSVHPTDRACQQIAELIWSGTRNITGPYNLKALFV